MGKDIKEQFGLEYLTSARESDWKRILEERGQAIADAMGSYRGTESLIEAVRRLANEYHALRLENERLKRGEFNPEEFQIICHNIDEKDKDIFCKGCEEYQIKLFGASPSVAYRSCLEGAGFDRIGEISNMSELNAYRLGLMALDKYNKFEHGYKQSLIFAEMIFNERSVWVGSGQVWRRLTLPFIGETMDAVRYLVNNGVLEKHDEYGWYKKKENLCQNPNSNES